MITNTNMLCYGITMLLHITNSFFLSFTIIQSTTYNLQFQHLYAASGLFLCTTSIKWTSHYKSINPQPHSPLITSHIVSHRAKTLFIIMILLLLTQNLSTYIRLHFHIALLITLFCSAVFGIGLYLVQQIPKHAIGLGYPLRNRII